MNLRETLETKIAHEAKLEQQLRDAKRQYADLESRMKEDLVLARIRDAENIQNVAELTQKISSLEFKVHVLKIFVDGTRVNFWTFFRTKKS